MKAFSVSLLFIFYFFTFNNVYAQAEKPNILWIVCEDISPTLAMYGDSMANTPNLNALAAESTIYTHAFATVGVCAPARSSIITGMYPTSIGTMHMRTAKDVHSWGRRSYESNIPISDINGDTIRQYAAVIPEEVKCFTEHLRREGYYCTNNQKTDYQFAAPLSAWDQNNNQAHWRNRPSGSPFFSVFNIGLTHESRLWLHADKPLTIDPDHVQIPPYLPNNAITRRDIARHYSNVELMDARVGEILAELKEDGLYQETIIFFYSDHGGPLPRQKREIYDSGLHVPFMVKYPEQQSSYSNRLISFVDLAPTVLSLAGIKPPTYMQGSSFAGKYDTVARDYIYGSSDRFDEYTDRIRAVRNHRYLYLRNYFPSLTKYKDVAYRKNIPMMQQMLQLEAEGKLNDEEKIWFQDKVREELYDCESDAHTMYNLMHNDPPSEVLVELRAALLQHLHNTGDWGQMPESQMIQMMWPDEEQPKTEKIVVTTDDQKISLHCKTLGASVSYLIGDLPDMEPQRNDQWLLYEGPIKRIPGKFLYALAERIGYQESELLAIRM